ncbi:MAG: hypothetical protein M1835_002208 [Candelina submexicana]|nr:MAG: hypothetical protein M1835_002208 [Candelina submexicana]
MAEKHAQRLKDGLLNWERISKAMNFTKEDRKQLCCLYHLTHTALYATCSRSTDGFAFSDITLEFAIEQERLRVWAKSANLIGTSELPNWIEQLTRQQLDNIGSLLSDICNEIRSLESITHTGLPPYAIREEMRITLMTKLLCVDEKSLGAIAELADELTDHGDNDIRTLAAMKFITVHMKQQGLEESAVQALQLAVKDISNKTGFRPHRLCEIKGQAEKVQPELVLIENIKYDTF